jgi:ATP-dependent helicase HrpB
VVALPIDSFIPEILEHVRRRRAVVVTAMPGAGKTTRVPPAMTMDGPVILLQPRRVAARAIAQRIAEERGWSIAGEIGWQIRFEHRYGPDTTLLVVTEGVLTARLQRDPLLSDFRTCVLDEFHERSLHADVGLALLKQAWRARDDLRIIVMSATLDAEPVSRYLDGCPIVDVPGRLFPVDIQYAPQQTVVEAVRQSVGGSARNVLCFLPGAAEIRAAAGEIESLVNRDEVEVVPLHGSLDSTAQDLALRPSSLRTRVVVATNIAETSLTVPGVTTVVDSGLQKVARYDAERAIDSLELERITQDSADQRAGRAGRVAPGVAVRLWDSRDRLRPHSEPEIHRMDLSAAALDIFGWGGDPRRLEWFEAPEADALERACRLLERLGALADGKLTAVGEAIRRLPVHPRLARMIVASNGAPAMAKAVALLSERHFRPPPRSASTTSDLLSAIDDWRVPPHVDRVAREIESMASRLDSRRARSLSEADFRRAVLAGYPDRVAQRREGSSRVRLASGTGAVLGAESGVHGGEFLVAIDVQAQASDPRRGPNEPRIRLASLVDREWLQPNQSQVVHRLDPDSGIVRARRVDRYDALVLAEQPLPPVPEVAAQLLADAWLERGPRHEDTQLLRRLRFAGQDADVAALVRTAAGVARSLPEISLAAAISPDQRRTLDREAPEALVVPSGRSVKLEYDEAGGVSAAVKLQELFGLAETPRLGARREPVRLVLLAPNGRPVQMTSDLRSFWDRTYPEVRKELRGRYPKHPWPEDPWSATPTARTKRR